ncbi:MAG TPA: hypothetical protein VGV35_07520, partial [Bryobacteraceae bacterium]|nr:hypothetical protein [Bryobacteraceae bacterium]
VLLLHISNLVLNLEPVARGLAAHLGWTPVVLVSAEDQAIGESSATWVLLTGNPDSMKRSGVQQSGVRWVLVRGGPTVITWTDDFASLWPVLKKRSR